MNSIGIAEGTIIKDPQPKCHCDWITITTIPPSRMLERKCDYCKDMESMPKLIVGKSQPKDNNMIAKIDGDGDLVWVYPSVQ